QEIMPAPVEPRSVDQKPIVQPRVQAEKTTLLKIVQFSSLLLFFKPPIIFKTLHHALVTFFFIEGYRHGGLLIYKFMICNTFQRYPLTIPALNQHEILIIPNNVDSVCIVPFEVIGPYIFTCQ